MCECDKGIDQNFKETCVSPPSHLGSFLPGFCSFHMRIMGSTQKLWFAAAPPEMDWSWERSSSVLIIVLFCVRFDGGVSVSLRCTHHRPDRLQIQWPGSTVSVILVTDPQTHWYDWKFIDGRADANPPSCLALDRWWSGQSNPVAAPLQLVFQGLECRHKATAWRCQGRWLAVQISQTPFVSILI